MLLTAGFLLKKGFLDVWSLPSECEDGSRTLSCMHSFAYSSGPCLTCTTSPQDYNRALFSSLCHIASTCQSASALPVAVFRPQQCIQLHIRGAAPPFRLCRRWSMHSNKITSKDSLTGHMIPIHPSRIVRNSVPSESHTSIASGHTAWLTLNLYHHRIDSA